MPLVREMVTEVVTETATMEIALTVLGIAVAVFVAGMVVTGSGQALGLRTAALAVALSIVCVHIRDGGWLTGADRSLTSVLAAHRSAGLDHLATVGIALGAPAGAIAVAAAIGMVLIRRRWPVPVASIMLGAVMAAVFAGAALGTVLGPGRAVAGVWQPVDTGNAVLANLAGTAAVLGMAAVITGIGRSRTLRTLLAAAAVIGVVALASARLYTGIPLTGVVAGVLVAAICLTVGHALLAVFAARVPSGPRGAASEPGFVSAAG
ncbi:hypothetical protein Rhow_004515 [Rhodococcus wratislaviensis]|uniref:Uncharacterized protein n=1 Tax=Rhodococcus wratislaviensis TaxID=44752 RepID=A0A402CB54_RHOWR|nr:hypothetical protein Rhow_004515 [Rhodococcus wratislaviensis]